MEFSIYFLKKNYLFFNFYKKQLIFYKKQEIIGGATGTFSLKWLLAILEKIVFISILVILKVRLDGRKSGIHVRIKNQSKNGISYWKIFL